MAYDCVTSQITEFRDLCVTLYHTSKLTDPDIYNIIINVNSRRIKIKKVKVEIYQAKK